MELTDNDRQRIEQIARNIASHILGIPKGEVLPDDTILIGAKEGAEYATLYERQQQANLKQDNTWLKKLEFYTKGFDTKKFQKVEEYVKWVRVRDDLPKERLHGGSEPNTLDFQAQHIEQLEAERSELNEIVKIIDAIVYTAEFKRSWPRTAEVLIEKLNSLKTK